MWRGGEVSGGARSRSARVTRGKFDNMFYTYVLKSLVNRDLYIGFSEDLRVRVKTHNAGVVKSTKVYRPWELVYHEAYKDKKDATKREKQLKGHKAKQDLRKQIENSLV